MKKAIIDIGSNTVKLCIGKSTSQIPEVIYEKIIAVKLSGGFTADNNINEDTLHHLYETIDHYIDISKKYNVETLFCVATEALRKAQNEKEILSVIQSRIPQTKIITGKEEAQLIGLIHKQNNIKNTLIIDIGGGSVEFIEIENNKVKNLATTPLGSLALARQLNLKEQLSEQDILAIRKITHDTILPLDLPIKTPIIGTEGAFTNLFFALHHNSIPKTSIQKLDWNKTISQLKVWQKSTAEERNNDPNLDPQRQHIAHIASALLLAIIEIIEPVEIKASSLGLKESLLRNYNSLF